MRGILCGILPEFPRSFLLPMKEERGKGQEEQSESSYERENVGEEVEDDDVNAMNNMEIVNENHE